ncbi:MAG: sporulation protein YunB [Clostridia bacterium]|nr:sporulation protein YunB [Clostridia bacterium]
MYYNYRKKKYKKRFIKLFFVLIFMIFGLILFDIRIKKVVESSYSAYVKKQATNAVISAVNTHLSEDDNFYQDIITVSTDEGGKVTSIKTDTKKLNTILADLSSRIVNNLENKGKFYIYIPIGSVFSDHFFAGKGPKIKIRGIFPPGQISTDLKSDFVSAGINQTKHSIYLDFSAKAGVILATKNIDMDFKTRISIAETVIVGDIPESFTNVEGDDSSILGKINDYAN